MALAVICTCQRHLRISFFLALWMCSYIQMTDQLRLDLSDLQCKTNNPQHINHKTDVR
jgi:predicted ferric reductase